MNNSWNEVCNDILDQQLYEYLDDVTYEEAVEIDRRLKNKISDKISLTPIIDSVNELIRVELIKVKRGD